MLGGLAAQPLSRCHPLGFDQLRLQSFTNADHNSAAADSTIMANDLDGTCFVCGSAQPGTDMPHHLADCLDDAAPGGDEGSDRALLIHVEAVSRPHWLSVLAPMSAALSHLDDFLREIWLECCGHLSEFKIDGTRYAADGDEFTDFGPAREPMDVRVGEVLADGTTFEYTYDFGTATRLQLTCHGDVARPGNGAMPDDVLAFGSTPIRGVARNELPQRPCEVCGEPAPEVCSNCLVRGEGFVCERHRDDHDCEYPSLLPVVNSPRMGVCGYTG